MEHVFGPLLRLMECKIRIMIKERDDIVRKYQVHLICTVLLPLEDMGHGVVLIIDWTVCLLRPTFVDHHILTPSIR